MNRQSLPPSPTSLHRFLPHILANIYRWTYRFQYLQNTLHRSCMDYLRMGLKFLHKMKKFELNVSILKWTYVNSWAASSKNRLGFKMVAQKLHQFFSKKKRNFKVWKPLKTRKNASKHLLQQVFLKTETKQKLKDKLSSRNTVVSKWKGKHVFSNINHNEIVIWKNKEIVQSYLLWDYIIKQLILQFALIVYKLMLFNASAIGSYTLIIVKYFPR